MAKKDSDGKSHKVTVPENTTIEKEKFYLLGGFLGQAVRAVTTGQGETSEVVLVTEPLDYTTSQIDAADDFNAGDKVYWDKNNNRFTTVAADGDFCGIVITAKNGNGVIVFWFLGLALSDATVEAAAAVADLVPGNAQGAQATLNTGVVGNNNAITFTADAVGDEGNDITVEMVDPGQAGQVLAVDVNDTDITVNLATDAGTAASGTTGVEGNNNGITWTAANVGAAGNDIRVVLEDPDDVGQALTVSVAGSAVIVSLATDGGGAINSTAAQVIAAVAGDVDAAALVAGANTGASTGAAAVTDEVAELAAGADPAVSSTAAQVIAAVNNDVDAGALVTASNTGASNGNGTVAAVAQTNLAGGVDSEGQQALVKINELLASLREAGHLAE